MKDVIWFLFDLVKCKGFLQLELDHKQGAIMVDMLAMSSLQTYES